MCINCNDSLQVNLPIGQSGINGTNGTSSYVYIATANDNSGNGFSYPMNPAQSYIAIITSTTPITSPTAANFLGQWHLWTGATGAAGSAGTNGTNGVNGAFSFQYKWNTNTVVSDPGSTYLKINNASVASATSLMISETEANSINIANSLALAYASGSTAKSLITISKKGNSAIFASFVVLSGVDSGTYQTLTVIPSSYSSTTPFSSNDDVVFSFSVVGDKGTTGATGATGATGPTGPQGPAGSSNLSRPGSATSVSYNNYVATNQGSVVGNYFQYNVGTTPSSGAFLTFTSAGATGSTKSQVTLILMSVFDNKGTPTDYSTQFQGISPGGSGSSSTITFSNSGSTDTASYTITDTYFSGTYVALYVSYVSSSGSGTWLTGASGKYDIVLDSIYGLTLQNQNYNRYSITNTTSGGSYGNLVVLRAPQSATPGTLMVVEIEAPSTTSSFRVLYAHRESGSTQTYSTTLGLNYDYAKLVSHNGAYAASTPISLEFTGSTPRKVALLQFYVVEAPDGATGYSTTRRGLAFMSANMVAR